MPDPPRRIFLAMGCFFPHEIATKETFSVLSSFACSFLYLLSLNVFGFFIFYFPTISLSFSIQFLWIFFHRTVWTAWSVFFRRFISCHPLTFFCFSALFITLRRPLQFSYTFLYFSFYASVHFASVLLSTVYERFDRLSVSCFLISTSLKHSTPVKFSEINIAQLILQIARSLFFVRSSQFPRVCTTQFGGCLVANAWRIFSIRFREPRWTGILTIPCHVSFIYFFSFFVYQLVNRWELREENTVVKISSQRIPFVLARNKESSCKFSV